MFEQRLTDGDIIVFRKHLPESAFRDGNMPAVPPGGALDLIGEQKFQKRADAVGMGAFRVCGKGKGTEYGNILCKNIFRYYITTERLLVIHINIR